MRLLSALILPALACSLAAAESVKLEMVNGRSIVVAGPVERHGGLWHFRGADGSLRSIRANRVARIVPLATEAKSVAVKRDEPPRYEIVTPTEGAISVAEHVAGQFEPWTAPAELPGPPEDPRDEGWWRNEAEVLQTRIVTLELQERIYRRFLICTYQGTALSGCRPEVNRLPPVNRIPFTPDEKLWDGRLDLARYQLADARAAWAALVDAAAQAGIPRSWLDVEVAPEPYREYSVEFR